LPVVLSSLFFYKKYNNLIRDTIGAGIAAFGGSSITYARITNYELRAYELRAYELRAYELRITNMTKLLFQALHRPDRSPSQRYRFDQYLPFLAQSDVVVDYSYLIEAKDDAAFYASGNYLKKAGIFWRAVRKRMKEINNAHKYDLVFVQREAFMLGTSYFERKIAAQRPLIFDFDDAIWQQVVSEGNRKLAFLKNANKTQEIIRAATEIWAGNDYLADFARQYNQNVRVVPTTVDTDEYQHHPYRRDENAPICIGWSGSFTTVPHFESALPALEIIAQKYGRKVCFKLIGDANYRNEKLRLQGTAWARSTEIAELSSIDIGIMPLPDDEWTQGKCGLKALVYMSMLIPTVLSPVGVNRQIVSHNQNGLWASSTDEWVEQLSRLIDDADLRQRLAQNARLSVVQNYSVDAWKQRYLDYFDDILKKY
jgi:glycosyltransferase involved in cell wall biosynthesis